MGQLTRGTGNSRPKLVSPPGYEVVDTGKATEIIGSGELCVQGASGWSKAPAGSQFGHGLALMDYVANQGGCDFLIQGEMDGYGMPGGIVPGSLIYPSTSVAGGLQTDAPAGSNQNTQHRLTITGGPTGGTITFRLLGQDLVVPFDAAAAAVDTLVEALTGIGAGNVTVTGGALPGTPIVIEYNAALAGRFIETPVLRVNGLTGGTAPAGFFETVQAGAPAIASRMRATTATRIRVNFV